MLVDAVLWTGLEGPLLELRLRTLADVVDHTVVVACTRTHQGELVDREGWQAAFVETVERADHDPSKVSLHWCAPDMAGWPDGERGGVHSRFYQRIERQHRNSVRWFVEEFICANGGCKGRDHGYPVVVMVSDVDEIPTPVAAAMLDEWLPPAGKGPLPGLVLEQRFHSTALDLLHPHQPWLGTCAQRAGDLEPQAMRDSRAMLSEKGATIPDAGWHMSWFGTDEERQWKLDSFSHAEKRGVYDPLDGRRRLLHANGEQLVRLPMAEALKLSWPKPIVDGTFEIPSSWWSW